MYTSGISGLLEMRDANMFTDEDLPKPKLQKRKSLAQAASPMQQEESYEAGGEVAAKMPKAFKRSQKSEYSLKKLDSSRSPQSGLTESLPLTAKSANEYRALRLKYLLLEEESCALGEELERIEIDVKILEEEKYGLLDQLVVLEGLVEPPNFESSGQKV
eukprot:Gb_12686 [translate_table: standard]